jgi:hypothetical protein
MCIVHADWLPGYSLRTAGSAHATCCALASLLQLLGSASPPTCPVTHLRAALRSVRYLLAPPAGSTHNCRAARTKRASCCAGAPITRDHCHRPGPHQSLLLHLQEPCLGC